MLCSDDKHIRYMFHEDDGKVQHIYQAKALGSGSFGDVFGTSCGSTRQVGGGHQHQQQGDVLGQPVLSMVLMPRV